MFDMNSSRSLRVTCVALCLVALPLAGCPEEEENNKTTADMATTAQDMTAMQDMSMSTSDMSTALDAATPDDMPRVEPDLGQPIDAGEPDMGASDAGESMDAGSPDLGGEDMSVRDMAAEDMSLEDMNVEDMPQDMSLVDMAELDAGAMDMAGDMMSDAGVDMAPTTCSVGVPRCFVNDDCADASTRCDADAAGIACCLPGPRGVDPPGTPCIEGNDCDSSLCIGDGQGGLTYCSKACTSDSECVAQLPRCNPAFGICIPSN